MLVLVAGSTSVLGRHVITELKRRGHHVRALSRSEARARATGADEVAIGDALAPHTIAAAVQGVDAVISSVGASVLPDPRHGLRGYRAIDVPANLNLLAAARAAKVQRFVYVSVFGAERSRHLAYCDAHERVVDALKQSGLAYGVARPTAFFSALDEFLRFASLGVVPVFGAGYETNPIHDADLASVCVDLLEQGGERDAGGPEVLTRRQIAELAIAAKQRGRVLALPPLFLRCAALAAFVFPRVRQVLAFFADVMSRDVVAAKAGTRTLAAYFRER